MLENHWSAVRNPTSALGPSGASFGPSSLAPLLSNLTAAHIHGEGDGPFSKMPPSNMPKDSAVFSCIGKVHVVKIFATSYFAADASTDHRRSLKNTLF